MSKGFEAFNKQKCAKALLSVLKNYRLDTERNYSTDIKYNHNEYYCYSQIQNYHTILECLEKHPQFKKINNSDSIAKKITKYISSYKYIYHECIAQCGFCIKMKYFAAAVFVGDYKLMPKKIQDDIPDLHPDYSNNVFEKIFRDKKKKTTNIVAYFFNYIRPVDDAIKWLKISKDGEVENFNYINHNIMKKFVKLFDHHGISRKHLLSLKGPVCSSKCLIDILLNDCDFNAETMVNEYVLHGSDVPKVSIPTVIVKLISNYI